MTVMATPESVGPAGKVVEREKLHRSDRFPEWASTFLGVLKIAEKVHYRQNLGFSVVFAPDHCQDHLGERRCCLQSCRAWKTASVWQISRVGMHHPLTCVRFRGSVPHLNRWLKHEWFFRVLTLQGGPICCFSKSASWNWWWQVVPEDF